MSVDSTLFCPTCGQKLPPKERRVCGRCNQPILRGHRYGFIGSLVVHKCCENPTACEPAPEKS